MTSTPFVIATIKPWNIDFFTIWKPPKSFAKHLILKKEDLTYTNLKQLKPKYVFFPHWSWIIPKEVYENFECVIFHMTDLPFGRGGSPLQNLLTRGIYKTKISAIRAVKELDAGPIYLKRSLDISYGSAQEIYTKASKIITGMIKYIIVKNPRPKPQKGKITLFKRRTPEESLIPNNLTIRQLYDFIRMLDAEGYPLAFIKRGNLKFEFKNATLNKDIVEAKATISKISKND